MPWKKSQRKVNVLIHYILHSTCTLFANKNLTRLIISIHVCEVIWGVQKTGKACTYPDFIQTHRVAVPPLWISAWKWIKRWINETCFYTLGRLYVMFHSIPEDSLTFVFLTIIVSPHFLFVPSSLQESILSHVQRIVKGEVNLAMKEQQAVVTSSIMQAMRSAAGTPVPTAHLDYQTQQANILQLLQQGQLNQAFQQVTLAHWTVCPHANALV